MRRQIRRNVFETNSSSTHSVSIRGRRTRTYSDIPKHSVVIIDGTYKSGNEIWDELGKLNFVVTMLASIIEYRWEEDDIKINSFKEMVELDWFQWLKEVVWEESHTRVLYICPKYCDGGEVDSVPYYDTTYDEYETIESIFTNGDESILDDEQKFKARVKDIIYNPNIEIESKENEH